MSATSVRDLPHLLHQQRMWRRGIRCHMCRLRRPAALRFEVVRRLLMVTAIAAAAGSMAAASVADPRDKLVAGGSAALMIVFAAAADHWMMRALAWRARAERSEALALRALAGQVAAEALLDAERQLYEQLRDDGRTAVQRLFRLLLSGELHSAADIRAARARRASPQQEKLHG